MDFAAFLAVSFAKSGNPSKSSSVNHNSNEFVAFKLLFENELIKSLLTDSVGRTKSVVINKGYYNVSIIKKTILGNINLDVS